MSFSKQLYQNFLWRGIYFATVLLLNIIVARSYQASQSGWINYISNNFSFAITFGSLSLEVAVLYFGSSGQMAKEKLAGFSLLWSSALSVIFCVFTYFFTNAADGIASKRLIQFGGVSYFSGIMFTNFFMNLFVAQRQYRLPNILLGLMNLLLILVVPNTPFSLSIFDRESFLYVYFFWFVLQGLLLIIAYYIWNGGIKFLLPSKAEMPPMFKYAAAAFWGNVTYFLLSRIDYWLVEAYRQPVELGNYIQATKLGQTLLLLGQIAATTIFVHSAANTHHRHSLMRIFKMFRVFFLFFIFMLGVVLLVGRPVLDAIFGVSYELVFYAFVPLLPGLFFLTCLILSGAFLGANKMINYICYSNIVGTIVITILNLLFLPKHGIIWAALICSFGYFVTLVTQLLLLRKKHSFDWMDIVAFKKSDFKILQHKIK